MAGFSRNNEGMSAASSSRFAKFLSLADVAEVLNVDIEVVRELVESNELTAIRIGELGHWRVEPRALDAYVADQYERRERESRFAQSEFTDIPELFAPRER